MARGSPRRLVWLVALALPAPHWSGWVDPDTPEAAQSLQSYAKGEDLRLVMSDEFDVAGRSFADGQDPRWTAMDKDDYTNAALQYYKADLATTENGTLTLTTQLKETYFRALDNKSGAWTTKKKLYQSAMVNGWNKFCFTGGVVEVRAQLPGHAYTSGLWPALWLLGNLARATYVGSSDYMWPWSYDKCPKKEKELDVQQELNACKATPHYGLHAHQGRGAPEIDILEAMPGKEKLQRTPINKPYLSHSLQVSPGLEEPRPVLGFPPKNGSWYEGMKFAENASVNIFFYGVKLTHKPSEYSYQADAISANSNVDDRLFTALHTYRVEWEPPSEAEKGYIRWYIDGDHVFSIEGENLDKSGAEIPSEPMYLLMNTAISHTWGFPGPIPDACTKCYDCRDVNCACATPVGMCDNLPAKFAVDWIRVYQRGVAGSAAGNGSATVTAEAPAGTEADAGPAPSEGKAAPNPHTLGCSPKLFPTKRFIIAHKDRYTDVLNDQKEPLLPIPDGGASCSGDEDCGLGRCEGDKLGQRKCACQAQYTGPRCLAHAGHDDFSSPDDEFHLRPMRFYLPWALTVFAALAAALFVGTIIYGVHARRAGYSPLR